MTPEICTHCGQAIGGKEYPENPPIIVCLCGSTRFGDAFREANLRETIAGKIVLSIGCDLRSDSELWPDEETRMRLKLELDELHKRKIDLADEVLILNVGGYMGESTKSELAYAYAHNKKVRFLQIPGPPAYPWPIKNYHPHG